MNLTKLICLITVTIFLLSITVFSENRLVASTYTHRVKPNHIFPPCFSRIGVVTWGAGGAYVAEKGYPTAAFTNPAGLSSEKTTFYAEVGKRRGVADRVHCIFETKWDDQFILPGFALIIKPVKGLTFSIGYMNYHDLCMNIDSIPITTSESQEGTGEFFGVEEKLMVHTFFGASSYHFEDGASVGLTLGLNYLRYQDEIAELPGDGHGLGVQVVAGGLLSPFENFNIGAAFRYSTKIEYNMQYHSGVADTFFNPDIDGELVPEPTPFEAKFPWSLQIGASYRPFVASVDTQLNSDYLAYIFVF